MLKFRILQNFKDCSISCQNTSRETNRELNVKLWWIRARKRKKSIFFVTLILPEGHILICVFYLNVHCIEQTFRIYILLEIKNNNNNNNSNNKKFTSYSFLLVFKTVENFQCILDMLWLFPTLKSTSEERNNDDWN